MPLASQPRPNRLTTDNISRELFVATTYRLALISGLTLTGAAITPLASAGDNSGFYGLVGGGIGYWSNGDASRDVLIGNLGGGTGSTDKSSGAYKIGVGYQINTYNGFDFAYHYTGKFAHNIDSSPVGPVRTEVKVSRLALAYVLSIPATERLSILGRIGVHRWEEKITSRTVVGDFESKRNDTDTTFGIGSRYALGSNMALTLEYEYFHQQEENRYLDFSETTVGLQYRF